MTTVKTSGVGSRIETLKAEAMRRNGSVGPPQNPHVLNVALWRAMRPGRSRVQVRAAFLLEQVRRARIEIGPRWRLAGDHLPRAVAGWPKSLPHFAFQIAHTAKFDRAAPRLRQRAVVPMAMDRAPRPIRRTAASENNGYRSCVTIVRKYAPQGRWDRRY